jgi:hypothetical protein
MVTTVTEMRRRVVIRAVEFLAYASRDDITDVLVDRAQEDAFIEVFFEVMREVPGGMTDEQVLRARRLFWKRLFALGKGLPNEPIDRHQIVAAAINASKEDAR